MSLLNIDSLVLAEDTKCVEPEEIKIIIHNVAVFLPGESHGQRDLAVQGVSKRQTQLSN